MDFRAGGRPSAASCIATVVLGALVYPVALYFFMPRLGRHILSAVRILLSGQPREALKTVRGALAEQGI
jgi:hypothetical protein